MIQLCIRIVGGWHAGCFCGSGWVVFVHLAGGSGTCKPSAEEDPRACPRCAGRDEPYLGEALRQRRTPLDPSVSISEPLPTAGVLRHSVGTPVDGTTGLQAFVPLVRGAFAGPPGLGPDQLHQEPRPAAERRGVYEVHDQASPPSPGPAARGGRTF